MDVVTQALLGGVLAQSAARPAEKKTATLVGMGAGLLADADIFIRSTTDPLLTIEYHRHFTHALAFVPAGAALAWLLLLPFLHRRLGGARLYLFCLLGYSMSGVLDACTSYGTHLFWPFSPDRVAFNIISIIDPLFSLILLVSLLAGLWFRLRQVAVAGLVLCVAYLSLGYMQLQRAEQVATTLMQSRGHVAVQQVVKPTLGNLVLWRSVYMTGDEIYVDAVRVGFFSTGKVLDGESVQRFDPARDLPGLDPASVLHGDIQRFMTFSDDYVAFAPGQANVLGDIRYSMLPLSARPLWGIVIDPGKPGRHADYRFFRDTGREVREEFLRLLLD